ncbi:hypothetical protein ACLBPW_31205, partial [Klebsiella pneumoniae]|uniref:hypothetical protein n=1 Tax=Klebsiella pneumoniae TaxID=573 RepID=UPI0039683D59
SPSAPAGITVSTAILGCSGIGGTSVTTSVSTTVTGTAGCSTRVAAGVSTITPLLGEFLMVGSHTIISLLL